MSGKTRWVEVGVCPMLLLVSLFTTATASEPEVPVIRIRGNSSTQNAPAPQQSWHRDTVQTLQRLDIPYAIQDEAVAQDLRSVYVVGQHFVALWQTQTRREAARLDLAPYSQQATTQVKIALHPTGHRLYVALDQMNEVARDKQLPPQHQLLLLELDPRSLDVLRQLPFGYFEIPANAPTEKVFDFILSENGRLAYVFGTSKQNDSGKVGSFAWADLAGWKAGDIAFLQDIVKNSGILAVREAANWSFTQPRPLLLASTGRMLIVADAAQQNVLEGTVRSAKGFVPIRTRANLAGKELLGVLQNRLYYLQQDQLYSVSQDDFNANPIKHCEKVDGVVQFLTQAQAILIGGPTGLRVYSTKSKQDQHVWPAENIREPQKAIANIHVGRFHNQALVRLAGNRSTTTYLLLGQQ
ncbi:YncE family protein [Planctomycetota bacterium]